MSVKIADNGFGNTFRTLLKRTSEQLLIVSPYIGNKVAIALTQHIETTKGLKCTVITRFYREDFIRGASSISGLKRLITAGAEIYALQDLHSKLYVFDTHSVITGSFNFTFNGFYKNHEFGIFMEDEPDFTQECKSYFDGLLSSMKNSGSGDWLITLTQLENEIQAIKQSKKTVQKKETFNDYKWGAEIDQEAPAKPPFGQEKIDFVEEWFNENGSNMNQTGIWIKFEGNGNERVSSSDVYLVRKNKLYPDKDVTFFGNKPKGIKKGDLVFIAVHSDNGKEETPIIVGYGRAEGKIHTIGPDDPFYIRTKGKYPYYIKLQETCFVMAPIKHGVSLKELCRNYYADLYPTPKKSFKAAYSTHQRQSHLRLSERGKDIILSNLEKVFKKHCDDGVFSE